MKLAADPFAYLRASRFTVSKLSIVFNSLSNLDLAI